MTQSPELAGGEGFTFEGDAAAFYLTALLAEAYAPGIDDTKPLFAFRFSSATSGNHLTM